ncbi:cobyric acid synthase [Microlunatus endophyticus]|uniref:Cobyric acid synthase n=1 Tax=Microlunatus endophyticus TaxID=1716077 RepID=A0A917W3J2_9ACTN|nr:cobyric acid synthase [Microlunatus endophyticus]GGL59789.1 cobyric acid synthase [Microlunatus endophyticus]
MTGETAGGSTAAGLVVAGTSSDAGKSLVVAGLCRVLARRGVAVAPFKAQNMSNNSMVCVDGSEIGRAQYLQAQAAGVTAESAMNPVLLKPGSDRRSFVVVRGQPYGTLEAGQYATGRRQLAEAAFAAFTELAERFDVIICEGAGSPAEINLRAGDYVNLGLARRFELPMMIVGDIDRGGVLASIFGTIGLLDPDDRAVIKAYLINKFRGDQTVLDPGLEMLSERTGVPCAGVLPWLPELWLDSEDTLAVGSVRRSTAPEAALRVAVVRLPRISNATDVDALASEPGIDVTVTTDPGVVAAADLVVLPGSRSTVSDLGWLRERGIAAVLADRAARRQPVLGICGGYQMLARTIDDPVESGVGPVDGLGLLPTTIDFSPDKTLGRPVGTWRGHQVAAYEIHHGVAKPTTALDTGDVEPFLDGWCVGQVWGTMWHGTLENDDFRRQWLAEIAAAAGSGWQTDPAAPAFAERRERMINSLADALEEHADLGLITGLTRIGPIGTGRR